MACPFLGYKARQVDPAKWDRDGIRTGSRMIPQDFGVAFCCHV
jgi:hypothetical protein